jgi:hypothetical protein
LIPSTFFVRRSVSSQFRVLCDRQTDRQTDRQGHSISPPFALQAGKGWTKSIRTLHGWHIPWTTSRLNTSHNENSIFNAYINLNYILYPELAIKCTFGWWCNLAAATSQAHQGIADQWPAAEIRRPFADDEARPTRGLRSRRSGELAAEIQQHRSRLDDQAGIDGAKLWDRLLRMPVYWKHVCEAAPSQDGGWQGSRERVASVPLGGDTEISRWLSAQSLRLRQTSRIDARADAYVQQQARAPRWTLARTRCWMLTSALIRWPATTCEMWQLQTATRPHWTARYNFPPIPVESFTIVASRNFFRRLEKNFG